MEKRAHKHPAAAGGKWIRQDKRLAIYLRDGMACTWCGHAVEDGERLELDHLICCCRGGSNHETNLVTSCKRCNTSRGSRSMAAFATSVADYHQHEDAAAILRRVNRNRRRQLDLDEARRVMARR